jgi:hypothetical protein
MNTSKQRLIMTVLTIAVHAVVILLLLSLGRPLLAQDVSNGMVDPSMDSSEEPFCYFEHPTDIIGTWLAPVASEITPEGFIYTGFGELMFFIGNPAEPVCVRNRTLLNGYLPIVEFELSRHMVRYKFTLFAADLGKSMSGLPLNFARVTISNESTEERAAFFSTAYRFAAPNTRMTEWADYRFQQRFDLISEALTKNQISYQHSWLYSFCKDALLRDGRLLYQFPTRPKPHLASLSLNDQGIRAARFLSGKVIESHNKKQGHSPQLPMGFVMYRLLLQPGESRELVFKMPIVPLPANGPEAELVRQANCEDELKKVIAEWTARVAQSCPLHLPETKVQQYLLANTVSLLLNIDEINGDWVINVNKFQYHHYWVFNNALMNVALDMVGQQDVARRCLIYSRKVQFRNGNFGMPWNNWERSYEMTGYVLWGWGRHWELTRDRTFVDAIYPGVVKAVQWLKKMRQSDNAGLLPPVEIMDDAMLAGIHQTGQQIWNLIGLKGAIKLAMAAGKPQDADIFQKEFDDFEAAFKKALDAKTATTGGVITSALDGDCWGNHWDNLLMLYPEQLFGPFDPLVTATIRHSRSTYAEGLLSFIWPRAMAKRGMVDWPETELTGMAVTEQQGILFNAEPSIHYWQTPNNAQNALVRGAAEDQQAAVKDLYALLLHTSSTHAPQEFGTVPWGTRDSGPERFNILPAGHSSAKTIELLRNMLVRESGNDLYLLSAVSPEWLSPGKVISVNQAPTNFGPLSFTLHCSADSICMNISSPERNAPQNILVRIPWFFDLVAARVDGKAAQAESGHVKFTSSARRVVFLGHIKPAEHNLSYHQSVIDYLREYRRRYEIFLRTGLNNDSLNAEFK